MVKRTKKPPHDSGTRVPWSDAGEDKPTVYEAVSYASDEDGWITPTPLYQLETGLHSTTPSQRSAGNCIVQS